MDSDVAEKDPTGRYIRYHDITGSYDDDDDAVFKQYKAFDETEGLEVAWIQVSMDIHGLLSPDRHRIVCQEINLLKSLKHENVVKFHHSWTDEKSKRINIITESFASGTLREYRTKHNKIDIKVIKNWSRLILRGLDYLHSHNPPLFLQDFTCGNVFVNGNNGQVKIGTHFGLTILNKATHYQNNLYSFGMCLLEMITCENPYTEPACLSRVFDLQAKHLIEQCLSPSSMKFSAFDLLKHPFLAAQCCKETVSSLQLSDPICKQVSSKLPKVNDMKEKKKIVQLVSSGKKKAYGLKGMQIDERTISFTLDVVNKAGGAAPQKIEFPYVIDSDTSVTVAEEMIEQLDFSGEDVAIVVRLIDALLMQLVGCTNNNAIRQQNNIPSAREEEKDSQEFPRSNWRNKLLRCSESKTTECEQPTKPLENNRDDQQDELKLQLDAIDIHYVNRFQKLLKNISII